MEMCGLTFFVPGESEPAYFAEGFVKEFVSELHVWDFRVTYQRPGSRSIPDSVWRVTVGEKTYLRVQRS